MKKLIFIFLLFLISVSSCAQVVVKNVYQKTYKSAQVELAQKDVYNQLHTYKVDSIPLEKWLTNQMISDTTIIIQKMIRQDVDKKTNYQFIFTEYKYPKSSLYQVVVRETKK